MVYIISKPTRRERDESLRETASRSAQRGVRGVLRSTEEAIDTMRQIERETGRRDLFAVSAAAPESQQAEAELLLRTGINPETMEGLHSDSTRHA